MRKLLLDMTGMEDSMILIEAFVDNQDTLRAIEETKTFYKGKRIGLEVAKIKEMLDTREVFSIQWIDKNYQLADGLTKDSASRTPILEAIQKGTFMN